MYLDASLRRKVTAPIRSSGVPIFPTGIREVHLSLRSGLSSRILRVLEIDVSLSLKKTTKWKRAVYRAVSMYPGLMQLTRMP